MNNTLPLEELACVGQDGVSRTYYLDGEQEQMGSKAWTFRVHLHNPPRHDEDDWFDMNLVPFGVGEFMISSIANHGKCWYAKKGIGDALIPRAAHFLGARIVSSSNRKRRSKDEFRTCPAEKIWKRLVDKQLAIYDPDEDRYQTV